MMVNLVCSTGPIRDLSHLGALVSQHIGMDRHLRSEFLWRLRTVRLFFLVKSLVTEYPPYTPLGFLGFGSCEADFPASHVENHDVSPSDTSRH